MKKKEKEILIKLVLFMKIKMFFLNQKKNSPMNLNLLEFVFPN